MPYWSLALLLFLSPAAIADNHALLTRQAGELRWCADAEGGAPYVFPDQRNPSRLIGFEVDLMNSVARHLRVKPKLVLVQWDHLIPALLRGDCDVVANGLEITEARRRVINFTLPYFVFSEQLTLRKGAPKIGSLVELRGHRVGTLSASLAESMLKTDPAIITVAYPSAVEAYKDLDIGRVDAVLMDDIIAAWYAGPNPSLDNSTPPWGESRYGMGVRKDASQLEAELNRVIQQMIRSGELKALYDPWKLWTPAQEKLQAMSESEGWGRPGEKSWTGFLPLLFKGAGVTLVISILAMAIAAFLGSTLCYARLFGAPLIRFAASAYIEIVRGTPLLIQLFLLYYGLPNLGIQLNAFVAAVLGMGMNYAAYEAEIYRSAYLAIPAGQMDAARSIGMTRRQSLRFIMIPQALRVALPPSTNDFIALFKDTSLVSVITVSELTRAYSTAATTTYRFLELGLTTAALYFAMSYPLSLWSRSLEKSRHAAFH